MQFSSLPDKESFDKNKTLGQLKVRNIAKLLGASNNQIEELLYIVDMSESSRLVRW